MSNFKRAQTPLQRSLLIRQFYNKWHKSVASCEMHTCVQGFLKQNCRKGCSSISLLWHETSYS